MFHLDVACFHLIVAYVAVAIHVCCKCMFQMFHIFQTYVASILSRCCICCSGYTHLLQTCVSIISPSFQYVGAGAAPHALLLVDTHALHAPIQRYLSLSCGPSLIVGCAWNERSVPKWHSTPWSKCMSVLTVKMSQNYTLKTPSTASVLKEE
jgi:hypothetical protein